MQIADRFHLHQNLMEAVNKILGREVPVTNGIPINSSENNAHLSTSRIESGKKILFNVDNLSEKEQKRRKLIEQIQVLHKEEISVQEISQITGTDRKTVKKKILKEIQTNYVAAMYTDRWKDIPILYSKAYKVV